MDHFHERHRCQAPQFRQTAIDAADHAANHHRNAQTSHGEPFDEELVASHSREHYGFHATSIRANARWHRAPETQFVKPDGRAPLL